MGARLGEVINHYKISPNEFSKSIGFERADKIYNILNGKFNPSFEILLAITNKFVEVDIHWLITGDGEMLRHINKDGLPPVAEKTSGDPPECARCKDKDAVIAAQRAQIESQTELLDLLKQSRSSNDGQKRKTA